MVRLICWKAKLPEGGKKEIRVDFFGGKIRWQFKFPNRDHWLYDQEPSLEEWDELLDMLQRRYQRGNAAHKDLLLVEKGRTEFLRKQPKAAG
jgi:hypothetical protein